MNSLIKTTGSQATTANSLVRLLMSRLPLILLLLAAIGWHKADAFGSINIFKHRYPFYGGYGYGYPFYGGYGAGYKGINIGGGGWGR